MFIILPSLVCMRLSQSHRLNRLYCFGLHLNSSSTVWSLSENARGITSIRNFMMITICTEIHAEIHAKIHSLKQTCYTYFFYIFTIAKFKPHHSQSHYSMKSRRFAIKHFHPKCIWSSSSSSTTNLNQFLRLPSVVIQHFLLRRKSLIYRKKFADEVKVPTNALLPPFFFFHQRIFEFLQCFLTKNTNNFLVINKFYFIHFCVHFTKKIHRLKLSKAND